MKQKTIVSTVSLIASLGCYYYARSGDKDAVPYVMIGGFIGAMLGETLCKLFFKKDDGDDNTPFIPEP